MKKRRSKIKSNTRQAQQNNTSRREKKLTAFTKKIVTDAKDNDIEKIHIISGGVKVLSKNVNRDEIIVRVPSRTQASFLKNYINGAASSEIPFQIEYTTWSRLSKLSCKAVPVGIKGAKGNEDDGTGKRRGRVPRPIVCDPGEIIGIGAMPKTGRQISFGSSLELKKTSVGTDGIIGAGNVGTGARSVGTGARDDGTDVRRGKTPPKSF